MPNARFCLVLFIGLALAGCASNDDHAQVHAISQDDADRLNAQHEGKDAVTDAPLTADSHYAAGQLAESQKSPHRALSQYAQALAINPNHLPSLYRMAVVNAQIKDFAAAVQCWTRYIKLTHGDAAGYSNLGFCYELSGNPDLAEDAYKKGISRDPNNQPCRVNYGLMLLRTGRIAEGTAQLNSVLPESEVHYDVASIYEMQGKKDQARAEYHKALQCDPTMLDARTRLASLD